MIHKSRSLKGTTSNALKAEANALFNAADPAAAITLYKEALASCPAYLHFPRAVLQSNIAACYLKTEDYADAAKHASDALDGLEKLDPKAPSNPGLTSTSPDQPQAASPSTGAGAGADAGARSGACDDVEAEIISAGAARAPPDVPKADIARIRIKALLRRARARSLQGGWSNLASSEQDYKALAALPPGDLTKADLRTVRAQLAELPARVKAAQEAEMAEMWGKLKGLGNSILRPFGLSTDNFQMVKDENTGGYSMNFTQAGAPK
ncbi:Tetratricopeptide repeat protein 1 [Escovopsis weberi]|uniref:Tetratricopeptide repeat protein 1 n=1 Tax=Escovopsis weberi TaxID=150374 RepID=A0A0M8N4F3_ESCWE|nr:Tetratricopeptide repeat protein 1 [Escovopsis weberi]